MRELAIPIVRFAETDVPPELSINLRRLAVAHAQPIDLPAEVHADLIEAYKEALKAGHPPARVMAAFERHKVPFQISKRVLESAIYDRRIRVDLFENWSVDFPLPPEQRDPLIEFAAWFAR